MVSGKGGTGKTSILACFAHLTRNKVLADCDVDAANLHLLLQPDVKSSSQFKGGKLAIIDKEKCTRCGECEKACQFEAIKNSTTQPLIDPLSCEGCCLCARICPEDAIRMEEKITGWVYLSKTKYGPLIHAKLGIGEGNSGKLVTRVRTVAAKVAQDKALELTLIDGSPGIGCPVIASLTGADLALIVTEPTLSGMADLERIAGVCGHFGIRCVVCINKFDINKENTKKIEKICMEQDISVVGKISYDVGFTRAILAGVPLTEFSSNKSSREIKQVWEMISCILELKK